MMDRRGASTETPPRRVPGALSAAWLALAGVVGGALILTFLDPPPYDDTPRLLATLRLEWSPRGEVAASLGAGMSMREPRLPRVVEPAAGAPAEAAPPAAPPMRAASKAVEAPQPAPKSEPRPTPPSASTAAVMPPTKTAAAIAPAAQPAAATRAVKLRNARPYDAKDPRPRIAIVIVELGIKAAASEAAIERLPPEVTLAFSPFGDGLDHWTRMARDAGHEVLLTIPLEPADFPAGGPGSQTLLTSLSPQQNLGRLDSLLKRGSGYVGVTYVMGGRFTTSREALTPVLTAIDKRGLMFLDGHVSPRSIAGTLARELGVPRALGDRIIDTDPSRAAIDERLAEIEDVARDSGAAVALAGPRPVTFERLLAWFATLPRKGLALAPISAVADRQGDR